MREIKFRAWGKTEKRMYGRMWPKMQIDSDGTFGFPQDDLYEIMQFTGLHDKNGKEIYEGDVVAYDESVMSDSGEDKPNFIEKRIDNGFIYANGRRGERRYGREVKLVEWRDSSCGFEPFSDSYQNCGHCGCGKHPNGVEVIGNIYQDSHLWILVYNVRI